MSQEAEFTQPRDPFFAQSCTLPCLSNMSSFSRAQRCREEMNDVHEGVEDVVKGGEGKGGWMEDGLIS